MAEAAPKGRLRYSFYAWQSELSVVAAKTDGIDAGAPMKGAAALSTDNGTSSGTKSGSEIVASGGRNPFIGEGPSAKSTVFVVDVSGGMQGPDRLSRVLASMTRAIDFLTSDKEFAIILFDDQAYAFPNQLALLSASNKNKQEAFAWLNATNGRGGTNPIPGMDIAIRLAPERIVLLSDGEFDPRCIQRHLLPSLLNY